jgi:hypothetical protein
MSTSIQVNGQAIELVPQERGPFMHLSSQLIPQLDQGAELAPVLFGIIAQGLQSNQPMTHPVAQSVLWMLWQMGIRDLAIDLEQQRAHVQKSLTPEERARDTTDPYSPGGISCGRGNLQAVSVFSRRQFRLDGEMIRVKLRPPDDLKAAMKAVQEERLLQEWPTLTAARLMAGMIFSGATREDPRVLAMVQVLADHGIAALRIDATSRTITFEGFEPEFAAAAAYLQGGDATAIARVRQGVREMIARASQATQQPAQVASGTAPAAPAPGTPAAAGASGGAPAAARPSFKRRRR